MTAACNFEGCTVAATGSCALERDPATCEHRVAGSGATSVTSTPGEAIEPRLPTGGDSAIGAPVLETPSSTVAFPSSTTLGPDVVSAMMASRYVTVVGILGDPESGKTACLASLYLMVSNATFAGWSFADSKSLMAFEEIARGARDWNEGQPPDQMTVHTEMTDDRRPGFLHLRMVRASDGRRVDFALPDLPGEWTTSLVGTARADRFEFLKSADALWVVVDGRALADREARQGVISRLGQLAGRLQTLFDNAPPRIIVVATHRDGGELAESVLGRITAELAKKGVVANVIEVAPFSANPDVEPGYGLPQLIEATLGPTRAAPEFWPARSSGSEARAFLRFRSDA